MIFAEWGSLFAVVVEVLQLQKLLALEQARAGRSIIIVMSSVFSCFCVDFFCFCSRLVDESSRWRRIFAVQQQREERRDSSSEQRAGKKSW